MPPPRLQNSTTLQNPLPAPINIFSLRDLVYVAVFVVFSDIKRRIGEYGINRSMPHVAKDLQAVICVKNTVTGGKKRLGHKDRLSVGSSTGNPELSDAVWETGLIEAKRLSKNPSTCQPLEITRTRVGSSRGAARDRYDSFLTVKINGLVFRQPLNINIP